MSGLGLLDRARAAARPQVTGQVVGAMGLTLSVEGIVASVGDLVEVNPGPRGLLAEVVAVTRDRLTCMPLGELSGVHAGARVRATGMPLQVPVGEALLGRVLDGLGRPVDGGPPLEGGLEFVDLVSETPHPLARSRVQEPLTFGVRALDTLVPCGKGQRLGIFAGSGVGKSTLLSQITRGTDADIRVIGLIGERGREVKEFLEENLGPEGMARTVVVVATSDEPPLVRLKAAFVATRIAEGFRDQGRDVLLLMDSITRTAMAQREVGLSAGEPPATRGYPPSVFAMMPRLLEKAGTAATGSITGLYTVLVDGDDHNEPIADTARSILDGHIVLTRKLATAGHFPAIDVLESISRVAGAVVPPPQMTDAREVRRLMGALRDVKELIEIGAYQAGSDPLVDRARQLAPAIEAFLQQPTGELTPAPESWAWLNRIVSAA
ncbi:FliI/YscN family ATPase [Geodermatophilus sabuli]|uniref:Flagellum-specific ATP synthase n=1 Tax=Geodermatophilus sabuli TaxID=1564158 RepID=A0A285EGA2_9ACTN|nr:FliI/YscN family ATPase [Geodermatophilus sabuli]MBB3083153.1 flagellum-specific ATP synthase [Geodermatophilus sabuli]SNX98149.1 flagellum-specific ATP synthase [Geodermatophilus sabuli]